MNKRTKNSLNGVILGLGCLFSGLVFAAKPIFLIEPTQRAPSIIYKGQTATAVYRVTNNTPYALNGNGVVNLPQGVKHVGGTCSTPIFNLPQGSSCTVNFQIVADELRGNLTRGPEVCNTPKNRVYCSKPSVGNELNVVVKPAVSLTLSGSPLTLTAGGSAGMITVTNTSTTSTAVNIAADFTGTALSGQVTQDASQCVSLPPGQSCSLIFTPGTTAITQTSFPIKGSNTQQIAGAIAVVLPTQAPISVSGSPLTLTASGASGSLTVTNQSTVLTATSISANLTGTALEGNMTQDASNCTSVLPQHSCTLTFTPGSTAVSATTVPIQGSNTSQTTASIAINAAPQAPISITGGQTMTLYTNDVNAVGWMVVKNNSSTLTATNIAADFTSTALNGHVTQDATNCVSVAPNNSCTLYFTVSGTTNVSATEFGVSGSNTMQATGKLMISTITNGQSVGDPLNGGKIASLNVAPSGSGACGTTPSTLYLVAATADYSSVLAWDSSTACVNTGTCTQTNVTDITNGSLNTSKIVSVLQGLPGVVSTNYTTNPITYANYAAGLCSSWQVDENGSTPCVSGVCYEGWYLPAQTELYCLYNNQNSIGGFSPTLYWSSTEDADFPQFTAWFQYFFSGSQYPRR